MIKQIELSLPPEDSADEIKLKRIIKNKFKIKDTDTFKIVKLKRSIDARSRFPFINLLVKVYINESLPEELPIRNNYKKAGNKKNVIIVGAGPAGYFAALELIELGLKPVIFDRGKDVRSRRKDLRAIQQFSKVNPDSNYCFGEGGAGTYSDGKLYTRSHKRGDINKVLKILVEHGADTDILIDAHPHIGSNKLPGIIANIRNIILEFGGEVNFDSRITDFIIKDKKILGVTVNNDREYFADAVILATGHSARDIFFLLKKKNIKIQILFGTPPYKRHQMFSILIKTKIKLLKAGC